MVDLQWGALLFDSSVVEYDQSVGEGHGFDLVVGDVQHGGAQGGVEFLDFYTDLSAQGGVEVGQGFIEQEQTGSTGDGASHGDSLSLASGQLSGIAFEQVFQAQHAGDFFDAGADGFGRFAPEFESEGQVVAYGKMWVKGVTLEHHGDVAVAGWCVCHVAGADEYGAFVGFFQACDGAEQGGFAAARRADEHGQFAVVHVEIDAAEDGCLAECFPDAAKGQRGHGGSIGVVRAGLKLFCA